MKEDNHDIPNTSKNKYAESAGSIRENQNTISTPSLELPKGGGAVKGIEEKFKVNAATGTSSFSIALPLSLSRHGVTPGLALSYNSGSGNSPFGLGWDCSLPEIARKTDKRLPEYKDEDDSDTFIFSESEDMIPLLEKQGDDWIKYKKPRTENGISYSVKRYRPRLEGLFARIEKWEDTVTGDVHWRSITKNNVHSYYGLTDESRISDPLDSKKIFKWLLCRTHDDKGNLLLYTYKKEDFKNIALSLNEKNRINNCTQTYIKKVLYGNKTPYFTGSAIPTEDNFLFKVIFDYGEHDSSVNIPKDIDVEKMEWPGRKDPFSSCRSGFEIRTYRRCKRVLMFHCFDAADLPHKPYLVKSLDLFYEEAMKLEEKNTSIPGFSYLKKVRQNGHKWNTDLTSYTTKSLPDFEFTYQQHEWNTNIQSLSEENSIHAPIGIDDKKYLWIDLFNEGISGILTEQDTAWYYKSNLGNGNFSQAQVVADKPNWKGLTSGKISIQDLEANGSNYLVSHENEPKGFVKLNEEKGGTFKTFSSIPNIDTTNPNARFIDLNGDGLAEILVTEEDLLRWYPGAGEKGFEVSRTVTKEIDEEKGPTIIFNDLNQSIFLADMNGDGLTDILRIRNGEICYWPNLGYGHFGPKVNMDNAPLFDHPDKYNSSYLRLTDIDGSGTTDIIYLGNNNFKAWLNLNGNEWTKDPQTIDPFPITNQLNNISLVDFLGSGTSCIVYSSSQSNDISQPIKYIDLMGSKKPHLLTGYKNNCGKEVSIEYKTSTHFYLEDKKEGKEWLTKLPFPIHCIYKVTSEDKISQVVFSNKFHYSHGYFDPYEREFRGFGRVEQWDTEEFNYFKINSAKNILEEHLQQPPVRTVSWFHTGAFISPDKIIHQYKEEYFQNELFNEFDFPEPNFTGELSAEELREALRACKGMPLRAEVYAEDKSPLEKYPYSASQTSYEIQKLQPKENNKFACFLSLTKESISYNYERNPADPKISHIMILETDELGNPVKKASAVYPRVSRPTGANAISDLIWNEQNKSHLIYAERFFTNDILQDTVYRLRAPYGEKLYDISGFTIPAGSFLSRKDLLQNISAAEEIHYEKDFTTGWQKRLSAHSKDYFIKEDLSGPLPLGVLSSLGILYKKYQLAFTKGLTTACYGTKVSNTDLEEAGYVHLEGDEDWWIHSGTVLYGTNPAQRFYSPIGGKDIFNNESFIEQDSYFMLLKSMTDAIGNKVTAINDYRILSPSLVTDQNLNRSAIETDELGMVVKSAVMGKAGANEGDTLDDPTCKMEYDLFNWQNNQKPNYVRTFIREQHGSANVRWQESYTYSDGGGIAIMIKTQAEPGKAKKWNVVSKQVEEIDANPRWVGNGRTIFNNKGNAIKGYEPYFSNTHEYESEDQLVETGFTPVLYYDPTGRKIKTEYPNGTFSKIEFTGWNFKSYDVNDTVKDSQWYSDRGSPNPDTDPEPADPEIRAAWLSARHHNTPSEFHSDTIGRPFISISDYKDHKTSIYIESDSLGRYSKSFDQLGREVSFGKVNMIGSPTYSITAEKGENWILTNAIGNIYKTWNNNQREFRVLYDKLQRPTNSFVKINGVEFLHQHIVYGDILTDKIQRNLSGKTFQLYDQSGVTTVEEADFKGNITKVTRKLAKEYKGTINWQTLNGLTSLAAIEAAALPLLENEFFISTSTVDALNRPTRVVLPDKSVVIPTYNEANYLDSFKVQVRGIGEFITFLENQDYSAMGQREFVKYGNGLITNYFYDPKTFRLINLISKQQGASDTQSHQNIHYTYDPVGNIIYSKDEAQQTLYFQNTVVKPESKFEYDALYQLRKATGRELSGLGNAQRNSSDLPFQNELPHLNDASAVRIYTENYEFDDCGNILKMQHSANGGNWTRHYKYDYQDNPLNKTNRLKSTSAPGDAEVGPFSDSYDYDLNGCMTKMPHLNKLSWNFMDHLKEVDLGGGGKAYYVYGASGTRVRKVIERPGGKRLERINLGTVEIYREYQNGAKKLERNTLHISDNTGRIAQVDTKIVDEDNADPANPLDTNLIRYQYSNHLGSSMMETDSNGTIISYEEYHPYGTSSYRSKRSSSDLSLKRYRFSGKERDDETGLYYFGARYYAPWLGRWASSDPANFADGLNVFWYCRNNPVMIQDPNGMESDVVGVNPKNQHLKDPSKKTEAHAYLEGVYTSRLIDKSQKFVIDEMHFDSSRKMWIVDKWHLEARGTGSSDASSPPGEPGGAPGGVPGGTPGAVVTPGEGSDAGTPQGTSPSGTPTGTGSATTSGGAKGSEGGSPQGAEGGSPGGSPSGTAGGSPTGTPGGTGSGSGGGRSFWSRGGSALLAGVLLLAAGLFTILTAGAGTPLLILAAGYMAAAGGAIMIGGSGALLGASYGGYTTAEEDKAARETLHDIGLLSSPFGLAGGAIGYGINGREGMRTGAMIGNVAHLGHGLYTFGAARLAPGVSTAYSSTAPDIVNMSNNVRNSVPAGTMAINAHGNAGVVANAANTVVPLSNVAPVVQAAPHGRVVVMACGVGKDPAAVQALANTTGRSVTAFVDNISTFNTNVSQVLKMPVAAGVPATSITKAPQYISPYLNPAPGVAAPAAATGSEVSRE